MRLSWQALDLVGIAARPAGFWTLAYEFVPGSRLLRMRAWNEDQNKKQVPMTWDPTKEDHCGADGMARAAPTGALFTSAGYGALIGKIGGGTADIPDTAGGSSGPYANKKVFAVGSYCIVPLTTAADGGPLFLTMNDKPEEFAKHSGELMVLLEYYPL
jgi:hypothetical protein